MLEATQLHALSGSVCQCRNVGWSGDPHLPSEVHELEVSEFSDGSETESELEGNCTDS